MDIPPIRGPIPYAGSTAWLVAWQDSQTGLFEDAGIYSEATPTTFGPINGRHLRPVTLLSMQSRFTPGQGGFGRAMEALAQVVERTPGLAWTTRTQTYRLMEASRKQHAAERAKGVVRVLRATRVVR